VAAAPSLAALARMTEWPPEQANASADSASERIEREQETIA
jgi:hypothetical protein